MHGRRDRRPAFARDAMPHRRRRRGRGGWEGSTRGRRWQRETKKTACVRERHVPWAFDTRVARAAGVRASVRDAMRSDDAGDDAGWRGSSGRRRVQVLLRAAQARDATHREMQSRVRRLAAVVSRMQRALVAAARSCAWCSGVRAVCSNCLVDVQRADAVARQGKTDAPRGGRQAQTMHTLCSSERTR